MESDPSLARSANRVVEHPVTAEGAYRSRVHDDRKGHGDDLLWGDQPLGEPVPFVDVLDVAEGVVELGAGDRVDVEGFLGHESSVGYYWRNPLPGRAARPGPIGLELIPGRGGVGSPPLERNDAGQLPQRGPGEAQVGGSGFGVP